MQLLLHLCRQAPAGPHLPLLVMLNAIEPLLLLVLSPQQSGALRRLDAPPPVESEADAAGLPVAINMVKPATCTPVRDGRVRAAYSYERREEGRFM